MENKKGFIATQIYPSPCGALIIGTYDNNICLCDWQISRHHDENKKKLEKIYKVPIIMTGNALIDQTKHQLDEYFNGKRTIFDLPIAMNGTDFQKKVWREVSKINYGEVVSYRLLAEKIGNPQAVRAVANANARNMLSILVPCHRVIGTNGNLTGYNAGTPIKGFLLECERDNVLL